MLSWYIQVLRSPLVLTNLTKGTVFSGKLRQQQNVHSDSGSGSLDSNTFSHDSVTPQREPITFQAPLFHLGSLSLHPSLLVFLNYSDPCNIGSAYWRSDSWVIPMYNVMFHHY